MWRQSKGASGSTWSMSPLRRLSSPTCGMCKASTLRTRIGASSVTSCRSPRATWACGSCLRSIPIASSTWQRCCCLGLRRTPTAKAVFVATTSTPTSSTRRITRTWKCRSRVVSYCPRIGGKTSASALRTLPMTSTMTSTLASTLASTLISMLTLTLTPYRKWVSSPFDAALQRVQWDGAGLDVGWDRMSGSGQDGDRDG
mmetsp:Transcript_1860/g.4178  ORF Transcript_1860/g.4178 Transcript_1860/m.4178 type:complete len:200 (-) Transcript_1860:563-1162(-)